MTTFQLIIVCFTLLGLAALAAAVVLLVRWGQPSNEAAPARIGHRVTVHTKKPDDQTIFGVLVGDYTDRVVLEDAEYVTSKGGTPISGRQDIATRDIAWIDVHALVVIPDRAPADASVEAPPTPRDPTIAERRG